MKFLNCSLLIASATLVSYTAQAKNDNKDKSLPPGLQKKVANGEPLPPGWQKKLQRGDILSRDIYERSRVVIPVDDKGIVSVQIDGTILRLYRDTREIIDILSR